MPKAPNQRLLLVEGVDDRMVLAEVFEKATGQTWEVSKGDFLVEIEGCGSDDQVLKRIGVRWKESGRKKVGVVIDADLSGTRWRQVRSHAPAEVLPHLPEKAEQVPSTGVVIDLDNDRRFGAWLMPDNQSPGALETFLGRLRSSTPASLREHVLAAMRQAQKLMTEHVAANPGLEPPLRPWKDAHEHKAEIHTWLAWQDPPGARLHEAVRNECLDVRAPLARNFVAWMKRLYDL